MQRWTAKVCAFFVLKCFFRLPLFVSFVCLSLSFPRVAQKNNAVIVCDLENANEQVREFFDTL
eukprot:m.62803 g.62803  ORF g.62803 m.62803 type:complete len:63 (-) comp12433_c1_seq2:497-685(-)